MVTRYTTALSLMGLATLASAQWVRNTPARSNFVPTKATPLRAQPIDQGQAKAGGDAVFNEDFANGLAGNNGVGAWTVSGADGALWQADTDGPNGDFSDPSEVITSPTAANGFLIFDSNLSNPGGSTTNRIGAVESPVLDLSATPNVHIEFESKLRWCCTATPTHWLEVSTDGGSTWPTRFNLSSNARINEDIHVNEDIGTHRHRINLSNAIAADPATVRIRFNHECYDCPTGAFVSHYHWQIDDLSILESYQTDVALVKTLYDKYPDDGDADLEYSVYPFSQLRELNMRAHIRNGAYVDATNVTLNVQVSGGGGQVFSQDGTIALLPANTLDSITVNGYTPAAAPDDLMVNFTLSTDGTDSLDSDNTNSKEFSVHPHWYALDDGSMDGRQRNGGDPYLMGNAFWIENDAMLYAIDVCVANGSTSVPGTALGATVGGQLLDTNLDLVELAEPIEITASNQITGLGQARWISLVFQNPVQLIGGSSYVAALEHFGGPEVTTATSGWSVPQVSFIFDNGTWFWQEETPMVRMNFDPSVSITEADRVGGVGLGQNLPNPADERTSVTFELKEASASTLEVRDLNGKLVRLDDLGNRGAGAHRVTINTADLTEGVYFYTLTAAGQRLSKRMVVVH